MWLKPANFLWILGKNDFVKIITLGFLLFFASSVHSLDEKNHVNDGAVAVTKVIFGIVSYTKWPGALDNLNICVVGLTHYSSDLLSIHQRSGALINVDIKEVNAFDYNRLKTCNVLYVGQLDLKEKKALYNKIQDQPVLSISEENELCDDGSLVCLTVKEGNVGFQINIDAVARSGLRIQPKVLKLGR